MRNLTKEQANNIVFNKIDTNLVSLVVFNSDPNNYEDMERLVDIIKYIPNQFKHVNLIKRIFHILAKSNVVDRDLADHALNQLDSKIYYSNAFNMICYLCLKKGIVLDYTTFYFNLFTKDYLSTVDTTVEYMKEYFLKYPVDMDTFIKWSDNARNVNDHTIWLAFVYAANGDNKYLDYLNRDIRSSTIQVFNLTKLYKREQRGIRKEIDEFMTLFEAIGSACKSTLATKSICRNIIKDIYSTIGIDEETINKYIAFILEGFQDPKTLFFSDINKYLKSFCTVLKVLDGRVYDENIISAINYSKNLRKCSSNNEFDIANYDKRKMNVFTLYNLCIRAKDKEFKFLTMDMCTELIQTDISYAKSVYSNNISLIRELLNSEDYGYLNFGLNLLYFTPFYCLTESTPYIPYDLLEKISDSFTKDDSENISIIINGAISNILTSYPKSFIDKEVMEKWSKSDNKVLSKIGKSFMYHSDPRFDYYKDWDLLYSVDNPDRDIEIPVTVKVTKDGALDSTIEGIIPEDAIIRRVADEVCRANKFTVTKITGGPFGKEGLTFSKRVPSFAYRVGETITIDDFDPTNEFGAGIYFNDPFYCMDDDDIVDESIKELVKPLISEDN